MSTFRPATTEARKMRLDFLSASQPLPSSDDALLTPLLLLCGQWSIPIFADRSTEAEPTLETTYYLPEKKLMEVYGIRCQSLLRTVANRPHMLRGLGC